MLGTSITPVSAEEFEAEFSERLDEPQRNVTKEAQALLGYNAPPSTFVEKMGKGTQDLIAVLREHGIKFYRPDDVESYKAKTVKKAERPNTYGWFLMLFSLPLLLFTIYAGLNFLEGQEGWIAIPIAATLAAFIGGLCWGFYREDNPFKATWSQLGLSRYRSEIPVAALDRALTLKRANPDMRFDVHYLTREVQRRQRPRYIDPLLMVSLNGSEDLCIAIWDEPKFTAKLHS